MTNFDRAIQGLILGILVGQFWIVPILNAIWG